MFNNSDKEFIEWIENLEQRCHDLIFEKSDEPALSDRGGWGGDGKSGGSGCMHRG